MKDNALKISTETLETHQIKLTVETEPQELEAAKQQAARKIAKQTKIPGFRPGKAPYHMVERHVGAGAILEEAIQILVDDIYPKALDEAGIQPYGPGRLENMPSTEPPTFEFIVSLEADVDLGDYQALRIEYNLEPVKDEAIDQVLDNLRQNQAVIEPVERPAQAGDMVQIRLSAERTQAEEGQPATLIQERSVPIVVESDDTGNDMEWPYPGFSRNLVGMAAGEEKEVHFTFPEESPMEVLRGKELVYQIKVETVKSRALPELTDELAVSLGEYETLEALRADIRLRLEEQASSEYNETYDDQLVDQLIEGATIKFPPEMLDNEISSVLHQFEHRLEQQNMDLETYLKTRQMDQDAFMEELKPVAEKRLKRYLVLFKTASQENLRVEPQEVQSETMRTIEYLTRSMTPKEARKAATQELISNIASNVTADMILARSIERLRAIAKGESTGVDATGAEAAQADAAQVDAAQADDAQAETSQAAGGQDAPVAGEPAPEPAPEAGAESEPEPKKTRKPAAKKRAAKKEEES